MNLTGLASGVDTDAIVEKLMALERAPQQPLKMRASAADARRQALADVQTRLRALQAAAQALRTPSLWASVQTVSTSDPARVSAAVSGSGAAPGGYQVLVTALASSAQRTYSYSAPDQNDTITVGDVTVAIPAGTTLDQAVDAINHAAGSPVYAVNVNGRLVLSSRTTGSASDAVASGDTLVEDPQQAVAGHDAEYAVNGKPGVSSTNSVTGAIPGLQLTFTATTPADGVSVNVSIPRADTDPIRSAVSSFVSAYNDAVSVIGAGLGERPVAQPKTAREAGRGTLYADTGLRSVLARLRTALSASYASDNPGDLRQPAAIGLSTGAAIGGAALSADSISGKIALDENKLSAALAHNPDGLRALLGGLGQAISGALDGTVAAGGTLDTSMSAAERTRSMLTRQIGDMDRRLSQKQDLMKRQFAAMEQAIQAGHSQSQWLSAQLVRLQQR